MRLKQIIETEGHRDMTKIETTFSREIGSDQFTIRRITFDGVREARGFNRAVTTSRHEYSLNGIPIKKSLWFALKDTAYRAA